MTSAQSPAILRKTIRELSRSGLTVADISRVFAVHPRAVTEIIEETDNLDQTANYSIFSA